MVEEQQEGEGKWGEAEWGGKAGGQYEGEGRDKEGREGGGRGRKVEGRIGARPTHNTLFHLILERSMRGLEYTQCTVNLEHSNALSTQCTRSNGHSALSATHLLDTKVPVRACVWSHVPVSPADLPGPLSLSLFLTQALSHLDLPVSVLSCDVRQYMSKPSGANWNQLIPVVIS